jgi:hypothetical protein
MFESLKHCFNLRSNLHAYSIKRTISFFLSLLAQAIVKYQVTTTKYFLIRHRNTTLELFFLGGTLAITDERSTETQEMSSLFDLVSNVLNFVLSK